MLPAEFLTVASMAQLDIERSRQEAMAALVVEARSGYPATRRARRAIKAKRHGFIRAARAPAMQRAEAGERANRPPQRAYMAGSRCAAPAHAHAALREEARVGVKTAMRVRA